MLNITANGYLGSDPEEREFNGNTVINFSLGSKDRKQNTLWLNCSVWGNSSNAAKQWLKKGSQITVHGRLSQNSYSKDGQRTHITKCRCSRLYFASKDGASG